jgi:long-chain acyl-CoA synthetase
MLARHSIDQVWVVHRGVLPADLTQTLGLPRAPLRFEDGRADPDLGHPPEPAAPDIRPESLALILYTSGSTGSSHGVVQTFRNIEANSRSIVEYLELTPPTARR